MTLQITLDQTGKTVGTAGQAREDLDLASAVTATATGGYDTYAWTLLDAPPNDAMTAPSAATLSAPSAQATDVTPDNGGTYLLRVAASLAGVISTAEVTFYAGPTLAADPASCPRRMPSYLETTEHNVPDAIDVSGNTTGWSRELRRWLKVVTGIWSWMSELLSPTATFESGADTGLAITRFDLPPISFQTSSAGYAGHTFDLLAANLPDNRPANVLIDWEAHAVLTAGGGSRYGVGCWKLSSTFEKSDLTNYLQLIGETTVVDIDTGAHTYKPATFGAASGGARTHTVVLNFGAATSDVTDWTVFPRVTIVGYPS